MQFSYTQISHYLGCPRRYRHRYLDGWQEKDTRAAMLFGRTFEQALGAYFRHEDPAVALYKEWAVYQKQPLHYSERDSWDQMLQQGIQLLERFAQEDRVRIASPGVICRSSSCAHSQKVMSLWPMWMLSADSTAMLVCWSGRPHRPVIQKNQKVC